MIVFHVFTDLVDQLFRLTIINYSSVVKLATMCPQTTKPKPLPKVADYGKNSIEVSGLTFSYESNSSKAILNDLNLTLETGSRCLLIGANGSGKSTLMRILAGRHLSKPENGIKVLGLNAFRDTKLNFHRAYLDCDWGMRTVAFAGAGVPLSKFMKFNFCLVFVFL